ncbi:MAG TPA: hypothetical protein VLJ68_06845 [Chitinophagaceae bacterium]|nr:hypothetical protein [Chitinophagaceae bacterium]
MKSFFFYIGILAIVAGACKSSKKVPFCADPCLKDSLKFTGSHALHPYVYISAKDCHPDSITWSYAGMGVNRKTGFTYLLGNTFDLNKEKVRCIIKDTAYALLLFNDCKTRRGFQVKLPYSKSQNFSIKSSGINNLDPKFSIADNLIAYTDRGNIYVEDIMTDKKAMMTFGKALEIDYDEIHDWIDSVNVTNTRIWVKVKVDGKWKELEKTITLE